MGSSKKEDEIIGKKSSSDDRLLTSVSKILQIANKPLHEIIRDDALRYLPVKSLLRLRSVSVSWNRHISSPIFTHTQCRTHRSLSGLFTNSAGPAPSFFPFDPKSDSIPDPTLSFLPFSQIAVKSSSNGQICCIADLNYVICNPSTTQWTPLPKTTVNGDAVLVFNPSVYNFRSDYFLICAFDIGSGSGSGVYGFHVFSSESGTWQTSKQICSAEEVVAGSGVSAGDVAYWRTSMQTVVCYDPRADAARSVTWPVEYADAWQLSEIGGKLCCVSVIAAEVRVHVLGSNDSWGPLGELKEIGVHLKGDLWPLRSQSANLEVMLWADGRVMVWDLVGQRMKYTCFGVLAAIKEEGYVSHISTFALVFRQIGCIAASPPAPPPLPSPPRFI